MINLFHHSELRSYEEMFYQPQIYVFYLFLFVCNAQEQLTCLRTDDFINSANPSSSPNLQRGYRGKQGPKGEKGEPGNDANSISLLLLRGNFLKYF